MAEPTIVPLTNEALAQFNGGHDKGQGSSWGKASSDGRSSWVASGEPTYEVISERTVYEEQDSAWFDYGWWNNVDITRVTPDVLHGPVFDLDTIISHGPHGPVFHFSIPDKFESTATLRYLGFNTHAIPVLWARYYSIIKAGCYKPYDLWDFVSSCILRPYPKDAHHWDSLDIWKEVADGLQLDEEIVEVLKKRSERHENFEEADRSFKSCVLWVMHQRWDSLFEMEVYTQRFR